MTSTALRDAILAALGTGPMSYQTILHRVQEQGCNENPAHCWQEVQRMVRAGDLERIPIGTGACYRLSEARCGASDAEIAQDGALKGAVVNSARKRGRG